MALGSLVSETFLAYQFLPVYKISGWKGGLEPGKLKLNLMTLGSQGSPNE